MDPYAEQFWGFTGRKELRLQKCDECGKFRWPPGPTCDRCLSEEFTWEALSGIANQVRQRDMPPWQYTIIHRNALLSDDDIRAVFEWTQAERARLIAAHQ